MTDNALKRSFKGQVLHLLLCQKLMVYFSKGIKIRKLKRDGPHITSQQSNRDNCQVIIRTKHMHKNIFDVAYITQL